MPGSRNGEVRKLRRTLAKLGRIPADASKSTYDGIVSKAVARIQSETSLDVDGIAGKQVRMVLQSWTKATGTPLLNAEAPSTVVADAPGPASVPPHETALARESAPETGTKAAATAKTETSPKSAPETLPAKGISETAHQDEPDPTVIPSPPVTLTNVNPESADPTVKETSNSPNASNTPQEAETPPSPNTSPEAQLTVVELPDPDSSAG